MLKVSALGVGIIGREGMSTRVLQNADIIVCNIQEGLELLFNPLRIKATLRSQVSDIQHLSLIVEIDRLL